MTGGMVFALPLLVLAVAPMEALDAGDRAWFAGDRRAAAGAWRVAARADDPAVRAMAELRLLRVSGNLGWMVHGPRADAALAACPGQEAWCALAQADLALTTRDLGLGGDPQEAASLARGAAEVLPGPALARRVWAGDAASDALGEAAPTALGEGLAAHGGTWPSGPGTWFLGLGVVGAPGLGVGGTVRFVHPDLGWAGRRLELSATATSRGIGAVAASFRTPGRVWWQASALGAHTVLDLYEADGVRSQGVWQGVATAGPGLSAGRISAWAGPELRVDCVATTLQGHGAYGGLAWDGRRQGAGPWATLRGEAAFVDYPFGRLTLDLRETLPAGPVVLAFRALGDAVPLRDAVTPLTRLPAAGGAEVLRGAPAGRYRGPLLAAAAMEVRVPLRPWLGAAGWGEAAWVPVAEDTALHPGAGLGLRVRLPPQPTNTIRLDLGFTDAGWGVATGWGEAF